jgi:hypothetical protein
LFSLLLVQTLASSLSAGLLGWSVLRFLKTPPVIATILTAAYSLDPLQLMYDRFVMAETFSLLAAMVFVTLVLLYVDTGRNRLLAFAGFAGVLAVALRISFLPPVAALSFAAPVIRFFYSGRDQDRAFKGRLRALFFSLAVVAISYFSLHTGYKLLTGRLADAPPAYQYADGFSLLSSWCTVMTPMDIQAAGLSKDALAGIFPPTLESRRAQRWMQGGLVVAIQHIYPDQMKANAKAKQIAFNILQRDPLGVASLAIRTYLRGWRRDVINGCIKEDTGDRPIPPELVTEAAKNFHTLAGDMPTRRTWTKSYFRHGTNWYRALLLTPLLLIVTTLFADQRYRPFLFCVALFATVVMLTATGLAVDNSIRYLHPLGWTLFVFAAYWIAWLFRKASSSNGPWLHPRVSALLSCIFFVGSVTAPAADGSNGPPGLYVRNGVLMRQGHPYLGIGANYNTLFGQLLQNKDDTSSLDKLARLGRAGIPFVRFRANGFGPENQQLYLQDRPEFFRRMDQVVQSAEKNKIGLIPSLFWRVATVSELVGEDRSQLGNPNSKANQFIRQFTQEMVQRYNDSPAIWGWEFGNEANLAVDLPNAQAHRGGPSLFSRIGDQPEGPRLTSQQLQTAFTVFGETVRKTDPSRIIEPGTALPRPYAWHLQKGLRGQPDSASQGFATLLTLAPNPMNMVSVHVYEKAQTKFPGARSTEDVLRILTQAAAAAHKPLFLGEFPTRDRAQTEEFLEAIEASRVPLSAFWVFDYPPQERTMSVSFDNQRAFVLDMVVRANQVLMANQ